MGLSVYSDVVHTHTRSRTNIAHHKNLLWELESLAKLNEHKKESTSAVKHYMKSPKELINALW